MTQKPKAVLLWGCILALLFVLLYFEEQQGGDIGKMAGRILLLALLINNTSKSSGKALR